MESQHDETRVRVILVDASIQDQQSLLNGIQEPARSFLLDAETDGIIQIEKILKHVRDQSKAKSIGFSVHLFCHDAAGKICLGSSRLDVVELERYKSQLQCWFPQPATPPTTALVSTVPSCLFFYGANAVLRKESGREFLKQLHHITGANVAASKFRVSRWGQGKAWEQEMIQAYSFSSLIPTTLSSFS